jgi:hypothetical protein
MGVSVKRAREIGKGLGVDFKKSGFTPGQLARGINIENKEHRDLTHGSYNTSAKIALPHLRENHNEYMAKRKK